MARSIVFSAVLHGALLAALLLFVKLAPSSTSGSAVVEVLWVELGDRIDAGASRSSGPRPVASADTPRRVVAETEREAEEAVPERAQSPRRSETTVSPAAGEPVPREAPRRNRSAGEPSQSPATSPQASSPPPRLATRSPSPSTSTRSPSSPSPAPSASSAPRLARSPTPTPAPPAPGLSQRPDSTPAPSSRPQPAVAVPVAPPPRTPIPEAQREALVEELEAWTRDADFLEETEPLVFEDDGREYTATFTRVPARDDTGIEHLVVAVSTERNGERLTTEMRMKRLAFSHFAQLVDHWDPTVQVHDDEIDGRFHSNSEIPIDQSRGVKPTFHGKVTTARGITASSATGRFRRAEIFRGGLETRAGRIALPRRFESFAGSRDERTQRFAEDARITFYADGTYGWRPLESSGPERRESLGEGTSYLVAGEDAELHVSGVVNGRVLVYSPEEIVIEDDLTYAADPEADPRADDYLGLVSDRNVEIAEPDVTGPGDVTVHAAIYAKRRFIVRRFRAAEHATLTVLGSLTAGSLSATEPRYRTKLRFDARLENARPPSFPLTGRYEVASSLGAWTIEPL